MPREVDELGLLDVSAEGILAVEWPERWASAPRDAIRVRIAKIDDETRHIDVRRPEL